MSPRSAGHGKCWKARGWRAADQARRLPGLALLALPLLAGCTDRLSEADPRPTFNNLFFGAHLEGREPPPGLDRPWPKLSSVPPRPAVPDAATRTALTTTLADARSAARTPLEPRRAAAPATPGPRAPAGGPPPRARIAVLPLIEPESPPPPSRDLLAPPPPPSRDLLAPRGN
jgi:hypothetical protein